MTQHTPGPWEVTNDVDPSRLHVRAERNSIHIAMVGSSRTDNDAIPSVTANARLIAAAPELLEALKGFAQLDWSRPQDAIAHNTRLAEQARAAIAKATGSP